MLLLVACLDSFALPIPAVFAIMSSSFVPHRINALHTKHV